MPTIRPISDLRNRAHEISALCHDLGQPVFITKNGKDDLVVMSQAAYDRQQAQLKLYGLLEEAADEAQSGGKAIPHRAMMQALKKRLG